MTPRLPFQIVSSTAELDRYATQLESWLGTRADLIHVDQWDDKFVRKALNTRFPVAPRTPLDFSSLPRAVKNELKVFWVNALFDPRKRSHDWFWTRYGVVEWLGEQWPLVAEHFNVNCLADIPCAHLNAPSDGTPYVKLPVGKFVANNPDYMTLYAQWAEKRFNRSTRQIVRTAKKNGEIVEREYWHGTIAVAGDIHREAIMFREQLKPLEKRNLIYIKDLYNEDDTRFEDRQKRNDIYINLYKYPVWMRDAVRLHVIDKIQHGELAPKTLVGYFGRFTYFRDFLYEKFDNPLPEKITPALIEEDFVAWGNKRKLVGKNWFTDTVQLLKAAPRLLPGTWPSIPVQARAVRKVDRKQAIETRGRLYASKEGANRAAPSRVVDEIMQHISEAPKPVPTIFLLAIAVGARAEDLHALLFDCLEQDPHDPRFTLLTFWQNKVKRWNVKPLLRSDDVHARIIDAIEGQQNWIRLRYGNATKYLFPAFHGEKESWVSFNYTANVIKQLCIEHDIRGDDGEIYNFTWHPLRHYRGTEMASQGHDILTIMMELGHQSPDMAVTYVNKRLELKKKALMDKGGGRFFTIEGQVDERIGELLIRKDQVAATRVCGGACTLPGQLGEWCQHAHACLSCKHFRADGKDVEFFKSEKAQLLDLVEQQENEAREQAEAGRRRMAELVRVRQNRNREALQNVDTIIHAIEEKGSYKGTKENLLKVIEGKP